jgi:hypothetical protein
MNTHTVTFAALAVIGVALSLAVVPALTSQAFAAQDFSDNPGKGHTRTCENNGGQDISKENGECPGQSEGSDQIDETVYAGKSNNPKHVE